jgi:preprotein translocase subunit YajC
MKILFAVMAMTFSALSFAEAPVGDSPMGITGQIIFLGGFLAIFYFLLWRPQSKRQKEHKELIGALAKGDEVVTAGGMLGKVIKVTDDFVVVEVGNGIQLPIQKVAVAMALPKGTIKDVLA